METLLNLLGAIALLILGAHNVRTGVLLAFGEGLRRGLARCVQRRHWGFLGGAMVTCLTQSSNATALMANGFASQGYISLAGALSVGLGADAGSALMARVLTADIRWLGPLLLCVGVWFFVSKNATKSGHIGRALAGLGLMLLALHLIVLGAEPIFQSQAAHEALESVTADIGLNVIIGAALAMASYSSLAAVLLTATLATAGAIPLESALELSIGATLGSGLLGAISGSGVGGVGRQSALASLAFKAIGVIIMLPLAGLCARALQALEWSPLQAVVNFHLAWNVVRCGLELLVVNTAAQWAQHLWPVPKTRKDDWDPKFLDEHALSTPGIALENATRETLRVSELVEMMLAGLPDLIPAASSIERARELRALDDKIDSLYGEIKAYLCDISVSELGREDSARWTEVMEWTMRLEQIGDILYHMVGNLANKKIGKQLSFSPQGEQELLRLCQEARVSMRLAMTVFLRGDRKTAAALLERKIAFRAFEEQFSRSHWSRLSQKSQQSMETSALHLDLVTEFRRAHTLMCSVAYSALTPEDTPEPALGDVDALPLSASLPLTPSSEMESPDVDDRDRAGSAHSTSPLNL